MLRRFNTGFILGGKAKNVFKLTEKLAEEFPNMTVQDYLEIPQTRLYDYYQDSLRNGKENN